MHTVGDVAKSCLRSENSRSDDAEDGWKVIKMVVWRDVVSVSSTSLEWRDLWQQLVHITHTHLLKLREILPTPASFH